MKTPFLDDEVLPESQVNPWPSSAYSGQKSMRGWDDGATVAYQEEDHVDEAEWNADEDAGTDEQDEWVEDGEDVLDAFPAEERFGPNDAPVEVAEALGKQDWPLALKLAIEAGLLDHNQLANLVFFTRHPELPRGPLDPKGPDFKKLAGEWATILDKEVWKAIALSAENTDLAVSGEEVIDHHRRFFTGKSGARLKKLVEDTASAVNLSPGLLGTIMMAETRRPWSYLSSEKVSSYHIGADDFFEGRYAIKARVPAYTKVKWDKSQKPIEHLNDAQTKPRIVKTILFDSGPAAVLATAVYAKFYEIRMREIAAGQGGDFDTLPEATRIALTRIAMGAGAKGATPFLEEALAGKDIFDRRPINVVAYQTRRNATVRTAQAMHLSEWVFGTKVAPATPPQPTKEVEESSTEPETADTSEDDPAAEREDDFSPEAALADEPEVVMDYDVPTPAKAIPWRQSGYGRLLALLPKQGGLLKQIGDTRVVVGLMTDAMAASLAASIAKDAKAQTLVASHGLWGIVALFDTAGSSTLDSAAAAKVLRRPAAFQDLALLAGVPPRMPGDWEHSWFADLDYAFFQSLTNSTSAPPGFASVIDHGSSSIGSIAVRFASDSQQDLTEAKTKLLHALFGISADVKAMKAGKDKEPLLEAARVLVAKNPLPIMIAAPPPIRDILTPLTGTVYLDDADVGDLTKRVAAIRWPLMTLNLLWPDSLASGKKAPAGMKMALGHELFHSLLIRASANAAKVWESEMQRLAFDGPARLVRAAAWLLYWHLLAQEELATYRAIAKLYPPIPQDTVKRYEDFLAASWKYFESKGAATRQTVSKTIGKGVTWKIDYESPSKVDALGYADLSAMQPARDLYPR